MSSSKTQKKNINFPGEVKKKDLEECEQVREEVSAQRKVLKKKDISKGLFLFIYLLPTGFLLSTMLILLIGTMGDLKSPRKFQFF